MEEFVREHKPLNTENEAARLAKLLDRDNPNDFIYDKPVKELSKTLVQSNKKEFNEIVEKIAAKDVKYQGADLDLGKWNEKTKSWDWNENRKGPGFDKIMYSGSPEGPFWRIVKDGDTLSKIIKEESVAAITEEQKSSFKDDFIKLNKITNPDHIIRGQALQIPNYEG